MFPTRIRNTTWPCLPLCPAAHRPGDVNLAGGLPAARQDKVEEGRQRVRVLVNPLLQLARVSGKEEQL